MLRSAGLPDGPADGGWQSACACPSARQRTYVGTGGRVCSSSRL